MFRPDTGRTECGFGGSSFGGLVAFIHPQVDDAGGRGLIILRALSFLAKALYIPVQCLSR